MNIFEQALRKRLRFSSSKGELSTEDLWDLPLTHTRNNSTSLDAIAIECNAKIERTGTVSFVTKVNDATADDKLRLEILKYIIAVKQEQNLAKTQYAANKVKKDRILELLAQKKDETLSSKSEEELQALADSL